MNFKAFILLGLLFGLVLISSTVTADHKSKYENTAVVNEATKETNPEQVDGTKQGGGGYCSRCCWLHGYHYCGNQCCWPEKKESKVVNEAAPYEANPKETNPEQVDGTKQGGGGYCSRCCWLHGYHYCGNQCCWPEKKESKVVNEAAPYEANPDGYGGGSGGGGRGGGWGGGGGGYGRGGGWGGGPSGGGN